MHYKVYRPESALPVVLAADAADSGRFSNFSLLKPYSFF